MKIRLTRLAERDARAAADWYLDQGSGAAADALWQKIDEALRLIFRFPKIGHQGPADTRCLQLGKFPYSLVYRIRDDEIRVIAISADRRLPDYWMGRR